MWNDFRWITDDIPAMIDQNRKFLIFSLKDSLYALDLAHVAEVDDPKQMYPIPLAPDCYCGAIYFHGDIVAVMNLASFLGKHRANQPGKMVVIQQEIASLAFLVDTIVRIISEAEVSHSPASDSDFASATLKLTDGEAILLDLEALALSAAFGMQRNQQVSKYIPSKKNTA